MYFDVGQKFYVSDGHGGRQQEAAGGSGGPTLSECSVFSIVGRGSISVELLEWRGLEFGD